MLDAKEIIYIGKVNALRKVKSYFDNPKWEKVKKLVLFIDDMNMSLRIHTRSPSPRMPINQKIKPSFNALMKTIKIMFT